MRKSLRLNQSGEMNALLIPVILLSVFFVSMSGFAVWAFASREDYKSNADQKVAAAVQKAKDESAAVKEVEFAEREKQPYREYRAPDAYGRVALQFPKTWDIYADERGGQSGIPVSVYIHPDKVPAIEMGLAYALRVQVVNEPYDTQVAGFEANIKAGTLKSTPFRAPKVPDALGVRLDGQISGKNSGTVILLPVRDKTLRIISETPDRIKDFNEIIVPSISFVP
jgi:hypothetical protein